MKYNYSFSENSKKFNFSSSYSATLQNEEAAETIKKKLIEAVNGVEAEVDMMEKIGTTIVRTVVLNGINTGSTTAGPYLKIGTRVVADNTDDTVFDSDGIDAVATYIKDNSSENYSIEKSFVNGTDDTSGVSLVITINLTSENYQDSEDSIDIGFNTGPSTISYVEQ